MNTELPEQSNDSPRFDVLFVDDSVNLCRSMELWLSSSGYRTITAHSAAEAEKISAEVTPKVVITDIGLPDSSGYDLRLRLQTISGMENAHFIALSGQSVNEAPQLAVESGFHSYITKPPDFEELADVLRECFRAQD